MISENQTTGITEDNLGKRFMWLFQIRFWIIPYYSYCLFRGI